MFGTTSSLFQMEGYVLYNRNRDDFEKGITPLHRACSNDSCDIDEISKILSKNPGDINKTDKNGNTPLHYCSFRKKGRIAVVLFLTQQGADLAKKNNDGIFPLDFLDTI